MLKITGDFDYYPTPDSLLDEITAGLDWQMIKHMLEPSAGRGNIAEYALKNRERLDIDCIEIEPELRSILTGKKFRVIHDDFLTLHTYKHYNLVFMNPPFSAGAKHLLKALEVQRVSGGDIICILNAETIRNSYTNERNLLMRKLSALNADISYYQNAFLNAENPTDVEIAVVKVTVPAPERKSVIFETLREKDYEEFEKQREFGELAPNDIVASYVAQYNREIEWGLKLYNELLNLRAGALDRSTPLILKINNEERYGSSEDFSVNSYVKSIRCKYWDKFFKSPDLTKKMTSNLQNKYLSQVSSFIEYDFSYFNIKTVMIDITKNLVKGVEECIVELFDKLSYQHSYDDDLKNNIHYYDGWKTNKSWYINKKVIIPNVSTWKDWDGKFSYSIWTEGILGDIEKALNYLDGDMTEDAFPLRNRLYRAQCAQQSRNIKLKFFNVTFYKKGTCHLEFTNEKLLKKLNIFGSQRKGWLPKGYGKKHYKEMTQEEQRVIDSFEGAVNYEQTVSEAQYYLFDASKTVPMLHE